jgi:hypothetical protein
VLFLFKLSSAGESLPPTRLISSEAPNNFIKTMYKISNKQSFLFDSILANMLGYTPKVPPVAMLLYSSISKKTSFSIAPFFIKAFMIYQLLINKVNIFSEVIQKFSNMLTPMLFPYSTQQNQSRHLKVHHNIEYNIFKIPYFQHYPQLQDFNQENL